MVMLKDKQNLMDAFLDSLLERMAQKGGFGASYKHDATGTPANRYMTGPGGIFGVSGLEQDVFSTRIQPKGLGGVLQALGSTRTNPLFPYLTGFLDATGAEPDAPCEAVPVAGAMKSCIQTAQFGWYARQTKEMEINALGRQTDRGNFLDLRLVNDPLVEDVGSLLQFTGLPANLEVRRDVAMAMVELGVSMQNLLMPQLYTGNPANNLGTGYAEFPGLDILISGNKVDAITGTECPSLDSDIKDFNCANVDGSDGGDIVRVITYMYRFLRHNADRMNFNPVEWVITMRRELFWEITGVWPCSYLTYQCSFIGRDAGARVNVDANDAIEMRDTMRQGNFLLIDGERVPVIIDDGIAELTAGDDGRVNEGCFCSDIYFIPLTVRGGRAVTYWEYLDYSQGVAQGISDSRLPLLYWSDGGRFLWTVLQTRYCFLFEAKIEPRIILLTPHLAGRIQNVQYCPLQHTRDPFPTDPYFVNGGLTSRTGPSYSSDWNLPA